VAVAAAFAVVAWSIALFGLRPITEYTLMMLLLAVQEMVLAVWLIVRGFGSSALRTGSPAAADPAGPTPTRSMRP
jgi:hypothetical protein